MTNLVAKVLDAYIRVKLMKLLLLVDSTQKLEARENFLLWFVGLDDGAYNRDVYILRTDVVCGGDHCNVNVCGEIRQKLLTRRITLTISSVDLVLRYNDLDAITFICTWDRMLEDTDSSYDPAVLDNS